jgi:pyruvate/2-oxoglutarate dehydrogenase complex dihydrolipoamide dehydrogenase (E3) component
MNQDVAETSPPSDAPTSPEGTAWPSDELSPPAGNPWDLLVIGGGTAGLVAAKTAAGFGAGVLLIERDRTGGDCLWTGCVPSKALLAAAHAVADARSAARYGIRATDLTVDFAQVMAHVRTAIATIEPTDSPAALRAAGVHVAHGAVRLNGPDTAEADGRPVRFRQALLASGSAPVLPPIPGLTAADPLTSDTVWSLTELPERLLVLGGGSIGCELGQAFARLGATVTIVESLPRLLAGEDADAAALLTDVLTADGVNVRTGVALSKVVSGVTGWCAELADGTEIGFDQVLVAVGRRPRTDGLGLEHASVHLDERGYVRVNSRLRTTSPRIWPPGTSPGIRSSPTPLACTAASRPATLSSDCAAPSTSPPSPGSRSPRRRSRRSASAPNRPEGRTD